MRIALLGLAVAMAAAVLGSGTVAAKGHDADTSFMAARDCIAPLYPHDPFQRVLAGDPRLAAIAQGCGAFANDRRHGGLDAVRARFYAGRANRMSNNIDVAIHQLEGAAAVGADYDDFSPGERRMATLELIHAYWQDQRLDDAQARLDDGLNRSRVLSSSDPAVAYQQAMLLLARSGLQGRKEAFNMLQTWFPGDEASLRQSGLSAEDIQSARSWVFKLGADLGRQTLGDTRDAAQRLSDARDGVMYFGAAMRTVEVACPRPRSAQDACTGIRVSVEPIAGVDNNLPSQSLASEIEYAMFGLGVSHLRLAGVADADPQHLSEAGGLDCLGGSLQPDAASHINEAWRAFEAIPYYYADPDGVASSNWGLGCTLLAGLSNTSMTSTQLERAIDYLSNPQPRSVNMLLTLAHAQVMADRRREAHDNLVRALSMPGVDNDLRAKVEVDIARTFYYQASSAGRVDPDLFSRTITDIETARLNDLQQPEVRTRLQQAADANNLEARLVLAHIALRAGNYADACPRLETIARAQPNEDHAYGVAPYLLSRCLTLREQTDLANNRRQPGLYRGSLAVKSAVDAYQLQNAHGTEYRRQACEAQITFGDTDREEYCSSAANPDAQSLLFQGMYWLRRGMAQSRGLKEQSFTRAMQAFVLGAAAPVADYNFLDLRSQQSQQIPLVTLNQYGQTFVQWCLGLRFTQQDQTARQVFLQAGMPGCR